MGFLACRDRQKFLAKKDEKKRVKFLFSYFDKIDGVTIQHMPIMIKNNGSRNVSNVRLMFDYHDENFISNSEIREIAERASALAVEDRYSGEFGELTEKFLDRRSEEIGHQNHVSYYDIENLRPGVVITIGEIFQQKPGDFSKYSNTDPELQGFRSVMRLLRNNGDIQAVSIVSISLFSDNMSKSNEKLLILLFAGDCDFDKIFKTFAKSLWLGSWPRAGWSFIQPGQVWITRKLGWTGAKSPRLAQEEVGIELRAETVRLDVRKKGTIFQ